MDVQKKIQAAVPDFDTLTESDCADFVLASRALSVEECYDYLMIDQDSLSEQERKFLMSLHKYGRAIGVKDATDKLFQHMSTRNGGQSVLDYLRQMSGEFSVEVVANTKSGFNFNVVIDKDK